MKGKLYHRMLRGILVRCVGHKEALKKLEEMHSRTYGYYREANLYRRLQRAGFYWPTISKEADQIQSQCEACQLPKDREESYVVFAKEDWGNPFIEYLASRTLPQKHKSRYKLKRSATCYFLHVGIQSRKGFGGDPL